MCSWWRATRSRATDSATATPSGPTGTKHSCVSCTSCGLDGRVQRGVARAASREELEWFHTPAYVDLVRERSASGFGYLDAGDTPAWRGVYEAASNVVGATLNAVDAVHERQRASRIRPDRRFASRLARPRRRLLRFQRLRRGDRNAAAPARHAARRLCRHRRASRRRRVLRVRGRSRSAVRRPARGRPVSVSRHGHGARKRASGRRSARS